MGPDFMSHRPDKRRSIKIDRFHLSGHLVTMPNATPPTSDRRSRLLEAASRRFAHWGFAKTSVDEIAAEAGVSKGAVYLEFPDKDALLKAVVHREFARFVENWKTRLEEEPGEWSFARVFQHSLAAMEASPLVKALLTRDQRIYGTYLRRNQELLTLGLAMRAELFGQLQTAGVVRDDIPAATLAYLLSVTSYGLIIGAEVFPEAGKPPFAESLQALALLLDRGLTPERPRKRGAVRALVLPLIGKLQATLHESKSARREGHRRAGTQTPHG